MKVLYMTNYPAPYRVDFFNQLGKFCDLTVTFEERPEAQTHRDITWFHTNYDNFNAVFLHPTVNRKGHTVLSMDIIEEIKKDYDAIIVGVYSTNTAMLAILYMIAHRISYLIETDGGVAKTGKNFTERLKHFLISHASGYFSPSNLSDEYLMHYGAIKETIFRYPFTSLMENQILGEILPKEEKEKYRTDLGMAEKKIILGVGQFIPRKRWENLIKVAPELEGVGIYIVGGNPNQKYIDLRNAVGAHNVHFIDFKKQDVLKKYYYAADLFVLPTHEDIWGLVINEAMSYGVPVITTDKCVAGIEMIETNVNGYLVEDDDIQGLKKCIVEYFSLDTEQKAICDNARKKAKDYTIERMVKAHMIALEKLCK